jgi:hypothetical protein
VRSQRVTSKEELDAAFALAPESSLVILSIESEDECFLGHNPEGAAQSWATPDSREARMAPCRALSDSLQRVAREADNVSFVALEGDASAEARALCAELGVAAFPTIQYYKDGALLWQHAGAVGGAAALGEGVLFYGNTAGGGVKASDYVDEVATRPQLDAFLASCAAPQTAVRGITLAAPCDKQLTVVNVSMAKDSAPCVHIYPAVLALAKNTAGAIRWARLLGDSSADAGALMASLNVTRVPTFVFFADGKEVGRYTGADRGALMAQVLETQAKVGYTLPPPPPRKRTSTADAKRIAQEARAREKAAGRQSGW